METKTTTGLRLKTDFYADVKKYGPIGEQDIETILKASQKTVDVFNVNDNPIFQKADIDIIQVKRSGVLLEDIECDCREDKSHRKDDYTTYEVKTDTFGHISRNIVYEFLSNGRIGCMARSKADYIYYVFLNENNEIVERFLFGLNDINKWLMQHFDKINIQPYIKSKFMKRGKDNTAILLINIDKLIEDGVAKRVTNT